MMTQNDRNLLANALAAEYASIVSTYPPTPKRMVRLQGFSYAVNCIAGVIAANNARFDRKRFFKACGLPA